MKQLDILNSKILYLIFLKIKINNNLLIKQTIKTFLSIKIFMKIIIISI